MAPPCDWFAWLKQVSDSARTLRVTMFFRFGSAVVLVVLISLVGTAVEKRNLTYRHESSRQHYRMEVLLEEHAKLRLYTQQMGAPVRLIDSLQNGELKLDQPAKPIDSRPRRIPLLLWQRATPRTL